jgi:hypothetical protein
LPSKNDDVPERYKTAQAIWVNLIRFYGDTLKIPVWALTSHFYHGIRKEYNKEILAIIDGGGDAYTRIHKLRELIND